jgi:hypothetical protein
MAILLSLGNTATYNLPGFETILDSSTKRTLRETGTGDLYKFQRSLFCRSWVGRVVDTYRRAEQSAGFQASRAYRRSSPDWRPRYLDLLALAKGTTAVADADAVAVSEVRRGMREDRRRRERAEEMADAMNDAEMHALTVRAGGNGLAVAVEA